MYKIKILILPKFEGEDLTDNYMGEARLFIDAYLKKHEIINLKNGKKLLYNNSNQIALGVCGLGKIEAASYLSSLFTDSRFDFSDAYILCVGCGGAAKGISTMGDVCIASEIINYDIGFETVVVEDGKPDAELKEKSDIEAKAESDIEARAEPDIEAKAESDIEAKAESDIEAKAEPRAEANTKSKPKIKWFYNEMIKDSCHKKLNRELVERVFDIAKDVRLNTTDITRKIMAENFPGEEWALREPKVLMGTVLTSDSFWKGEAGHEKALCLTEFYKCAEPYVITEMEDVACAIVADQFGRLDRVIDIRVSVNLDVFKLGETPEILWGNPDDFTKTVSSTNAETLDIFPVAMKNLFAAGSAVIEELLAE